MVDAFLIGDVEQLLTVAELHAQRLNSVIATLPTASHLGRGFSVVTTLVRTMGRAADLAERYGMQRFCAGIHACEMPVLELDTDSNVRKVITECVP
jgi:Asp/Glu/hydantoin racemase